GGMEGVYVDVNRPPVGFQAFARDVPMRGPMFSARQRLQVSGDTPAQPPGMTESDLYQSGRSGREGAAYQGLEAGGRDRLKGSGVLCRWRSTAIVRHPCAGERVARSLSAIR